MGPKDAHICVLETDNPVDRVAKSLDFDPEVVKMTSKRPLLGPLATVL